MGLDTPRRLIGIFDNDFGKSSRFLFEALAQLFLIEYCWCETAEAAGLSALVVLDGDLNVALAAAAKGIPTLAFLPALTSSDDHSVTFGSSAWIDPTICGRTFSDTRVPSPLAIPLQESDKILASTPAGPVWIARQTGEAECLIAAGLPPSLSDRDLLTLFFNGRNFMSLLPLMNFLRQAAGKSPWEVPAQRACFVFDDPSLYWRSYGFINYRVLAEHARQHNYSVSMATIPLDTWWVNSGVAATLRGEARLSVMVHGNNHTKQEMLAHRNGDSHLAVAAQSLRRMEQLERRGLSFSRVMEPPHGALACSILPSLLALGYEGALCTTELLLKHNPNTTFSATIGLRSSEVLNGLPVLPRIKMSPVWRNDVILAAFLRQPIILAGHHQDAAEGLKLLAEFAALVNSLGDVCWCDIKGILRTNYGQWRIGETLHVQLYSRAVTVPIPSGVTRLQISRSWIPAGQLEKLTIKRPTGEATTVQAGPISEAVDVVGLETVTVSSEIEAPLHYSGVPDLATSPWLIVRKILMELRDRLTPLIPFVDRFRRQVEQHPQ